jgi:hypothetical protein
LNPFQAQTTSFQSNKLEAGDVPTDFLSKDKNVIEDEYSKFIFKSHLSQSQLNVLERYKNAKNVSIPIEENMEDDSNNDYSDNPSDKPIGKPSDKSHVQELAQVMNVCYAGGEYRFEQYFERTSDDSGTIYRYKEPGSKKLKDEMLQEISPKIYNIMKIIEKSSRQQSGIIMIYSRYRPSGAYPVCVALEHAGFDRFGKDKNFITSKRKNSAKYILLANIDENNKYLFTEKSKEKLITNINENEQKDIKVIVCTDIVKEGVDFKNIRQIHILEPWHNESKMTQVIGRGVRMYSHSSLPEPQQNVTVFKHCCVHKPNGSEGRIESYDYYMYKNSQQNSRKIRHIENILQSNSIDCNLNKKESSQTVHTKEHTNMFGEQVLVELTSETLPCAHDDYNQPTGFNLHMIEHDVETVALDIQRYFQSKKVLLVSIDKLIEALEYSTNLLELFDLALSKLLKDKRVFSIGEKQGRLEKSLNHLIFVDSKVDYPIMSKMQLRLYDNYKSKRKQKKITGIVLPAKKTITPVQNIFQQIQTSFQTLKESIAQYVKETKIVDKTVYSMVLHRMNAEQSEAFIKKILDDQGDDNFQPIDSLVNDMIMEFEGTKYAVSIPELKFKFKHNDGKILNEEERVEQLKEKLQLKSNQFPKYYRKYKDKQNDAQLYYVSQDRAKPANATSNTAGQISNMIDTAKKFETNNDTIFEDSFDISNKENMNKKQIVDVLEYSARYYDYYVHPINMK